MNDWEKDIEEIIKDFYPVDTDERTNLIGNLIAYLLAEFSSLQAKHKQEIEELRMKRMPELFGDPNPNEQWKYGYNAAVDDHNTKLDLLLSKNEGEK